MQWHNDRFNFADILAPREKRSVSFFQLIFCFRENEDLIKHSILNMIYKVLRFTCMYLSLICSQVEMQLEM